MTARQNRGEGRRKHGRILPLALFAALAALPGLLQPAGSARADAPVFVIDQTQLPFDLSPGAPANSPARQGNLPTAAANSTANPANSSSIHANSPRNPANGKRVIFDGGGEIRGHYAPNGSGTLNLFDGAGRRVAYRPAGTKSLFSNRGEWCGTVATVQGGGLAFGIIPACAPLFFD